MKKVSLILTMAILLSISSVFSMTASADDDSTWPGGRAYFVPYDGSMGAFSNEVEVYGAKWDSSQLSTIALLNLVPYASVSIEFEFRPIDVYYNTVHPIDLWYAPSSGNFSSNLPSATFEFESGTTPDDNDVTICCLAAADLVANKSYYGSLSLTKKPNANFSNKYLVMSVEVGYYIPAYGDSIPISEQAMSSARLFGLLYSW